jgi:hypothetical protein
MTTTKVVVPDSNSRTVRHSVRLTTRWIANATPPRQPFLSPWMPSGCSNALKVRSAYECPQRVSNHATLPIGRALPRHKYALRRIWLDEKLASLPVRIEVLIRTNYCDLSRTPIGMDDDRSRRKLIRSASGPSLHLYESRARSKRLYGFVRCARPGYPHADRIESLRDRGESSRARHISSRCDGHHLPPQACS